MKRSLCCIAAVQVRKKTATSQHKIVLRTHSSGSLSICQHTPTWPTLFHSPPTRSSIHTPAHPPHRNRHLLESRGSPLFNWLVYFFVPRLLCSVPASRESISPCQPPPVITQQTHNTHTNTPTHAGSQVTGEQSHTSVQWKLPSTLSFRNKNVQ